MTTLFDSSAIVKPNTFARGVLPFVGQYDGRMPFTAVDVREAAEMFGEAADDYDVIDLDFRAAEAEAQDRLERGLCC